MKITLKQIREILSEISDPRSGTAEQLIENLKSKGMILESSQSGGRHSHKLDVRGRTEFYDNPDATDDDMTLRYMGDTPYSVDDSFDIMDRVEKLDIGSIEMSDAKRAVGPDPAAQARYLGISLDDWYAIRGELDDHYEDRVQADLDSLYEGDVIDMFSGDQKEEAAIVSIAKAMASRAESMLGTMPKDRDPKLYKQFLTPYPDMDGDSRIVRPLAQSVYEDYVLGKAGDQAESLDDIIERIGIDYFDEDIEYTLEMVGDDRFRPPFLDQLRSDIDDTPGFDKKLAAMYGKDNFTQDEIDQAAKAAGYSEEATQAARTKRLASQQDRSEIGKMELDFDKFLKGIESGEVIDLDEER